MHPGHKSLSPKPPILYEVIITVDVETKNGIKSISKRTNDNENDYTDLCNCCRVALNDRTGIGEVAILNRLIIKNAMKR